MNEINPVCEERHYWHKRFNFAAWLFLFIALYGIFFTQNFKAIFFSLGVSILFRAVESFNEIRHIKWHFERREEDGGENMHL